MTYNKFATLTPRDEEQEFDEDTTSISGNRSFALNTAVQETFAKRKVNTKKNIDMLVKGPRKSCWRLRQEVFRRPACMVDSVNRNRQRCVRQCNIARTRFLTMKFVSQLSPPRGENFQSATGEPSSSLGRPTVFTVHEGRNSRRHGHDSLPCDRAFGLSEEDLSGRSHGGLR